MTSYFVGLDVGQSHEYTTLAILEQMGSGMRKYAVRHLRRWPPGTGFPSIVEESVSVVQALASSPVLAVDVTAVGQAPVNLLRRAGLQVPLYVITLTAGHSVTAGPNGPMVPKKELVSTLQVLFQSRRLKVANMLPDARILAAELSAFKTRVTPNANDATSLWREGAHDDLVFAVALAAWVAENRVDPYTGPLVCWPPANCVDSQSEAPENPLREILAQMDRDEEDRGAWWR